MKQRIVSAAVLSCAVLLGPAAQAELPITINAGMGYWFFDSDRPVDDDVTPWISAEWAFTDNWSAELLYAKDNFDLDGGGSADVTVWQLDALYYTGSFIGDTPRLRPYFAFGGGEINTDARVFRDSEWALNAGAGVRWMLTPRFGARLEARLQHSIDESENDILVNAGVNYYFGNVTPPPAPVAVVAPEPEPAPTTRVASLKLKVNFAFDSDEVKEMFFDDIAELAAFLKRFDDIQVDVEGHTDSTGPEEYNQGLSERRAQAVVDLLVNEHGIPASRLNAVGFGESRPIASNDTREGRAENRRVMATLEVEFVEE
jgi:OOP family OmpA-OmpF porin